MARRAHTHPLTAIIGLGDNFYPHGVSSPTDALFRQWELTFLQYPSLCAKWYMLLGNHDYEGDILAQIYHACPHWTMPERTYEISHSMADGTRVSFFMIDTNASQDGLGLSDARLAADMAKLDRDLGTCDADIKFVCGHHPLFTIGSHHQQQALRLHEAGMHALLRKHNVAAYFAGHEHINECRFSPMPCYVAGCTSYSFHDTVGDCQRVDWVDERPAYLELVIRASGFTVRYIDGKTGAEFLERTHPIIKRPLRPLAPPPHRGRRETKR